MTVKIHYLLDENVHSVYNDDRPPYFIECGFECEGEMFEMAITHSNKDKLLEIIRYLRGPTLEPYILGDNKEE